MFKQANLDNGINDTMNDTINDTINERQRLIISIISHKLNITIREIAWQVGAGDATVKRDIDPLKEKDIITRMGSRKTGYWHINLKSLKNMDD